MESSLHSFLSVLEFTDYSLVSLREWNKEIENMSFLRSLYDRINVNSVGFGLVWLIHSPL